MKIKVPVGYMKPLVVDNNGKVLVDMPVAAWKNREKECLCTTDSDLEKLDLDWIRNIQNPLSSNSKEGKRLIKEIQCSKSFLESKGPALNQMDPIFFRDNIDFRPWYELEKDYKRFLVVNQYYWVEHIFTPFENVTEESIEKAGCSKLLECLRNGRATLVFNIPWESGWWNHENYLKTSRDLERLQIKRSVVIVCPQSKNIEETGRTIYEGLRFISFSNFEYYPWDLDEDSYSSREKLKELKDLWLQENRQRFTVDKKYFFCNVNSLTPPRAGYFTVLNNLVLPNRRNVNVRNSYEFSEERRLRCYREALERVLEWEKENGKTEESILLSSELQRNIEQEPARFSVDSIDNKPPYWIEYQPWRHNGLIEVFGETRSETWKEDDPASQHWFITEKTTKPLSSLKPFIAIANRGYLEYLHEQGYQTFGKWWDESYDRENSWVGRVLKIQKILKELEKKDLNEMYRMIQEMEEVLLHNFDLRANKILRRDIEVLNLYKTLLEDY